MTQYVDNITLATEQCCNCGMAFAMTADFMNRRRKDRETFYCPAGHPQHYTGESEESKLRRELERKQQMLDAETQRAQRISDERAEIAKAHRKMRVRVMNGVCPCCNRTFQNLLRHMQTEHKEEINLRSLRHAFGMTQAAIAKEIGVNSSYVSSYETGGYVPEYAKRCIDVWVESQTARAADAGGKEG